jgi:Uma2 family endonuclease
MVSLEEYLRTPYHPDVEFVDGVLVERNVGEWSHPLIQSNVLFALRRTYPHLKVVAELRSRVTSTQYRLPDGCVLLTAPNTKYLLDAAFLVVEVLLFRFSWKWRRRSPSKVMERAHEEATEALNARREGRHSEAASA